MDNQTLKFNLPEGFASALNRRHHGGTLFDTNPKYYTDKMNKLFKEYNKLKEKLHYLLDVEWDEKDIEGHFGTPMFYGAHRRLRNLEKKTKNIHKDMFYLLLKLDGNQEGFSQSSSIGAEDIMYDFKAKYGEKK